MRRPLKSQTAHRGPVARDTSLPAPIGGWNTRDSRAQMPPRYALAMENFFPRARSVDVRKGALVHATGLPSTPLHLMGWRGKTSSLLFACTDAGIYDVTAAGAVGAVASVLTNGKCQHVNFNTTGGSFLVTVNGTDDLRYYNGAVWTTVASFPITDGGILLSNTISFINTFKRAIYFIKKATMEFYYLPVDQITGDVGYFPLGAIFNRGGYLVAMGNWTFDGGVGLDDYTVFATSEGQLAVYKGTDPSSAVTWALQGVYDMGVPLGASCFAKYGGDLLYLSTAGLRSMSQALIMGSIKVQGSISSIIDDAFTEAARNYKENFGWQIVLNPLEDLLIVNIPQISQEQSLQYVMNLSTKAWCKFSNWNAVSWELYDDQLYMGVGTTVCKAWTGGSDFTQSITAYCTQAPQYLSPRSVLKQIQLVRPVMTIQGLYALNVEMDIDFTEGTDYAAPSYIGSEVSRYDEDRYDTAVWGALPSVNQDWLTVACAEGYAAALRLRVILQDGTIEWSSVDIVYTAGAIQG